MKCKFTNFYDDNKFMEFTFFEGIDQGSFNICTTNHVQILKLITQDKNICEELFSHGMDISDIVTGGHANFHIRKCGPMQNNKTVMDISLDGCDAKIEVSGDTFHYVEKDKHFDQACESDILPYIEGYLLGTKEI